MSDLIERQEAIDAIDKAFERSNPLNGYIRAFMVNVISEVMKMPSAQPEQRWIPVSKRLPKVGHSVLFSQRRMYTREGCLQADGKWWQYRWNEMLNADQVTAWIPLPEPYREDGGE